MDIWLNTSQPSSCITNCHKKSAKAPWLVNEKAKHERAQLVHIQCFASNCKLLKNLVVVVNLDTF